MYFKILIILALTFSSLYSTVFEKINPPPTEIMLKNQLKANSCSAPIAANEELSEDFKYGCFCGKEYPKVYNTSTQDFKKLDKKQRLELIESYFLVKPYDDIDAVCKQHDLCYLYQGKQAKSCNNAIYNDLHNLVKKFKKLNQTVENKQCQNLSLDIASVFKTIFASADDTSIFDMGSLMYHTAVSLASKTLEESVDTILDQGKLYPNKNYKCLINKEGK